jgi:hypothetical protein
MHKLGVEKKRRDCSVLTIIKNQYDWLIEGMNL